MSWLWQLPGRLALVDYKVGAGLEVMPRLPIQGGVTQSEAVQIAVELAVIRDAVVRGPGDALLFRDDGTFLGRRVLTLEQARELPNDVRLVNIAGDPSHLGTPPVGDPALPRDWGRRLALAIDRSIILMAESRKGTEAPATVQPGVWPIAAVAIAVTGAALAVVGSVAAWRFLEPATQTALATVSAASSAYAARLEVAEETGVMPPASPLETNAVDAVSRLADEQSSSAWMWGGGILGGFALGTITLTALRKAMA